MASSQASRLVVRREGDELGDRLSGFATNDLFAGGNLMDKAGKMGLDLVDVDLSHRFPFAHKLSLI